MNRSIAPEYKTINKLNLLEPQFIKLDNGIPVYYFNVGSQEVLRIEVLLKAGSRYQSAPLIAHTVNNMLNEGTKSHSAAQIAETFEYYGAYLHTECELDNASVILYLQNKHLDNLLPLFTELLNEAIFPDHELKIYLDNALQKFLVNQQKVNYLARKYFANALYGNSTYGFMVNEEHYKQVQQPKLIDFYKKYYVAQNITLIISGSVRENELKKINNSFMQCINGNIVEKEKLKLPNYSSQKLHIPKKDAVQNAIRIGKVLFNKTHQDYFDFQVLNTLLGGYFGSRLMSNIREDKGYTYGIGSAIVSLEDSGYFFISTEVGTEVCNAAIDEIYKEINQLIENPVNAEELSLVKNYLAGTLLRSLDGPFALAEKFKAAHTFGFGMVYYNSMLEHIHSITPNRIQELASRYLQPETLTEVVVGKVN
ncbi:MAG: M16 family metallopeptidase [Bacteroidia bacterium]